MQDPEKTNPDGFKGEKFGDLSGDTIRNLTKKGSSFFKKAKAAFNGDEAAKEDLADAAANAWVKTAGTIVDVGDKIEQKIVKKIEEREKKGKPPTP